MKKMVLLTCIALLSLSMQAQIDFNKIKTQGEKVLTDVTKEATKGTLLSNDEVVKGLREALNIGSANAGNLASKVDAYYKNPLLFIPFPPEAKKAADKLRQLGFGAKVDQFTATLNHAAENAAKSAAPIFVNAVKSMTITDGMSILKGNNDAATQYLKKSTSTQLNVQFKPVISNALNQTNATKYWAEIITIYNKVPGVSKMNPDLIGYTTQKAIDGLFVLVANEELKIRQDPAARVTDILRKVFGPK